MLSIKPGQRGLSEKILKKWMLSHFAAAKTIYLAHISTEMKNIAAKFICDDFYILKYAFKNIRISVKAAVNS